MCPIVFQIYYLGRSSLARIIKQAQINKSELSVKTHIPWRIFMMNSISHSLPFKFCHWGKICNNHLLNSSKKCVSSLLDISNIIEQDKVCALDRNITANNKGMHSATIQNRISNAVLMLNNLTYSFHEYVCICQTSELCYWEPETCAANHLVERKKAS